MYLVQQELEGIFRFHRIVSENLSPDQTIIQENELIVALKHGKVGAAGLDVFDDEPPLSPNPFESFKQVVLTPHIAGLSKESAEAMAVSSVQNVIDFFDGKLDPLLVVNKRI